MSGSFTQLTSKELPGLNQSLGAAGAAPLAVPPQTAFEDDDMGAGPELVAAERGDPDEVRTVVLPKNLRLWN